MASKHDFVDVSRFMFDECFIKCPMCKERYTKPKLLKCLHTFCENCITLHIEHAARNKEVTHREFPCPKCQTMTNVIKPELPLEKWSETLPANTMMEALLESISLQIDDKLCGTCEEGGITTVASFWCCDCSEPLCDDCQKYHRLMKISRRHKIEELGNFKGRHPRRLVSVPQPCPDHAGKDIELFCADHNSLCCVMCVATEHRRCEKVASIDKLAKQLEEDAVTEELVDKLNSYLDHIKTMQNDREGNITKLAMKKEDIIDQIANYKENINILLEKLEANLVESFDKIHDQETKCLKSEVEWCKSMQSGVENAKALLLITNRHCSNAQLFITVQQCIERSLKYEDQLAREQTEKFELIDYSFEIDSAFEGFLQALISVESFGKVHTHRRRAFIPASPGQKLLRDRVAEHVADLDAKTPTDTRNCCLSAVLFLSDKRMLVADQNNQKIKLFYQDGALIYEQAFTTWPRDFTELGNNRIAVTLPKERKIEIFYLGEKIKNLETIRMADECWGITYINNNLVVGCIGSEKGNIKILTLDGVEIDTIENDPSGRRLFIKTNYVIANDSGKEIYITDRTKDTVIAMALNRTPPVRHTVNEDQGPKRLPPLKAPGHNAGANESQGQDPLSGMQHEHLTESKTEAWPSSKAPRSNEMNAAGYNERHEDPVDKMASHSHRPTLDKQGSQNEDPGRSSPVDREILRSSMSQHEQVDKIDFEVLYSYSNDILKSAGGVAVDHQGNLYVTGYRSGNVHQISPGGSLIKIILQHLSQPLAVSVEPFGERIAVTETTSTKQNIVQIYKLV